LAHSGYRTMTVGEMVDALDRGEEPRGRVVLTFDDGYRDNHDRLLPLLRRRDATATVFVQTGPLHGRLNWLHHYFWILHKAGPAELGRRLAAAIQDPALRGKLAALPEEPVAGEYQLKRLLKYEIREADRDRLLAQAFREIGGDEAALARAVYLSPEDCRALDRAGVEVGAHTVNHLVLSSLSAERQREEIEGSLADLRAWLGHDVRSFAYPYGRGWAYNGDTLAALPDLALH